MLPPIPPDLQGQPLQIEFVSILALAQKASDNTQIERIARFIGFLAGIFPEAKIKFDAEEAIDTYATGLGTPPKIIRSDEIVAKLKQEMQAQANADMMAQRAPAMRDGAEAAKLMSETEVDREGTTALQRVLGQ
jgi:hypothetical protein